MRPLACAALLVLSVGLALPGEALGQRPYGEQQGRLIEVRKSQVALRGARAELSRAEELFVDELVSKAELERARAVVETAQLAYQQAILELLALEPWISIQEAMKYQESDGRRFVRLTLVNLTPVFDDAQFQLLNNFDGADPIPEELRQRDVRDVFVSLRDPADSGVLSAGTAIAIPYEAHVGELAYGASKTLVFQLLKDTDAVAVSTSYRGVDQTMGIQLQQAETEQVVSVTSTQISQEADLGTQATFDLRLERSSVDVRSFQLEVLGLPAQVTYSFVDPINQARLSQINFPAGVTERDLGLRLFLPERSDDQVTIDQAMSFWALVLAGDEAAGLTSSSTEEEIAATRAGYVGLQLTPRGVGRMTVSAPSLFSETRSGELVRTTFSIRNAGTRRLDNVKVSTEYPLNWRVTASPDVVPSLGINEEVSIGLEVLPAPETPPGEYEIRIRTESYADNRPVPSEDKVYRVSVKSSFSVLGTLALLALLLALVSGVVIVGVRITRR